MTIHTMSVNVFCWLYLEFLVLYSSYYLSLMPQDKIFFFKCHFYNKKMK